MMLRAAEMCFDHSGLWWPSEELQLNSTLVSICLSGPEEGALSPSSSSHTEEQDLDMVTLTSLSQQRGGGSVAGGEVRGGRRRRTRREGETKERTEGGGGGLGPPDLDLDLVEEEAQKEEIRRRSQTVRQKVKQDRKREQGSRSLPRNSAPSWDTSLPEEGVEVEPEGRAKERRRRSETKSRRRATEAGREEKREGRTASHTKHSGSSVPAQRSAFSFLRPLDDIEHQRPSDNESAASFSEVSLSAASITTAGWREDSDWGGAESPWEQEKAPGPWLKPDPQRMTQVLVGSRLSGRELAGGLSL